MRASLTVFKRDKEPVASERLKWNVRTFSWTQAVLPTQNPKTTSGGDCRGRHLGRILRLCGWRWERVLALVPDPSLAVIVLPGTADVRTHVAPLELRVASERRKRLPVRAAAWRGVG